MGGGEGGGQAASAEMTFHSAIPIVGGTLAGEGSRGACSFLPLAPTRDHPQRTQGSGHKGCGTGGGGGLF